MKKNIFIILLAIYFTSCMTENKVNRWNDNHEAQAAGYCADKFPPDTTTRVITDSVDTKAYEAAYNGMATYADSLFMQLKQQRESFKASPQAPCPPAVNLDSLRKAVDAEMRKRLAPCKDSIQKVTYTVVDKAREKQLQGKLDEKDGTITARDKTISQKDKTIDGLKKWPWLFWILISLIGAYTFLKLRFKLPF
jgi:hypothetical protein